MPRKRTTDLQCDCGNGFFRWQDADGSEVGEKEVKDEKDPERRKRLERSLDRERSARENEQARRDADAHAITEMRRQELRPQGGSRFNFRWDTRIEETDVSPEIVMRRLEHYIEFGDLNSKE